MNIQRLAIRVVATFEWLFKPWLFALKRKQRRDYYKNVYLKSDEWKRKRYVVLKRDNWQCAYCGARATQVHHKRYARRNIGKEPIKWLISICKTCHEWW
jgi:5-methylcytosine-specific restriction endonuclease McrA